MRCLIIALAFVLSGCDLVSTESEPKQTRAVFATCSMNNFKSFPRKVTGQIVFNTKTTVTIAVFNKNRSERVDITFLRNRCRW